VSGATGASDERLAGLLSGAGSAYSIDALPGLLAGVAGAPAGHEWTSLVAPAVGDELRAALSERLTQARQADGGLSGRAPSSRLAGLRAELERRGLDGFVVPRVDEHVGEYVPPQAQRLAWLTGFSGSAGVAVVLADEAAIFVDGRYTLQVEQEADLRLFTRQHLITEPPKDWIRAHLPEGAKLGFDPWLHPLADARALAEACKRAGGELVAVAGNPIDALWSDQPARPLSPVRVHPLARAGQSSAAKRAALAAGLADDGVAAAVLTLPDSICWLLNVRGADLPHNPMVLSFALLRADGRVDWFVDERKLVAGVREHLKEGEDAGEGVAIHAPAALGAALAALGAEGVKVRVDPKSVPQWIVDRLAGARLVEEDDPCLMPKACKNPVELAGAREAHRRDGAAVTRFLAWLDREAPKGGLDELAAAERLHGFRRDTGELLDLSFETISGAGPNGAIVHYRVTEESNRPIEPGTLYLVDSGGQYADGTTDITRTVAIGVPSDEMRDRFTRVLKGHIALATVRFPKGTTGAHLDTLARLPLWSAGLDYDHGTGHGVGSYLCVHEGPHRISKAVNTVALAPGMIVSNEPGYYKSGGYGIRIENLVVVAEVAGIDGAEREMLGVETLTLAPIDRRLVAPELLSDDELAWLNAYHARVRAELSGRVDPETATWLAQATGEITR
jgi:Xaa-Pro aminopeptidase